MPQHNHFHGCGIFASVHLYLDVSLIRTHQYLEIRNSNHWNSNV